MKELTEKTGGSRTTLRIDVPEHNSHVNKVSIASLAAGVPSLKT